MPHSDIRQIRDSLDSTAPGLPVLDESLKHRGSDFSFAPAENENVADVFATQEPDDGQENEDDFKPITELQIPEWFEIVLALTGIAGLQYKIQEEKDRRLDECYQNPYLEVEEFVTSLTFEVAIGFVILLNCVLIGWEASLEEGEMAGFFNVFEHFFTVFFFIEWSLRILAFGWVWVFEAVNFADSCLVFGTGVLLKWVAEPLGIEIGNFRILTVLRALRLVRLAKAVRLQPAFKEMWILIHGLTTSSRPLLWTLVIACSVLYVFAIAATELVGKSPDFKDDEYAQELFGNFLRSMFTMVQLITMDTYCDEVIRPMMDVQPWLGLFFVFFITVGVFIVMNLVTAIIVENAFAIVKEDGESLAKEAEYKKRHELKTLSDLFFEIDLDGSGELSKEEFFSSLQNQKVKQMLDLLEMKPGELKEVWDVLDDGDGQLTIKEFTDGIRRMKGEAKAKDIADVIKKLKTTDRKHQELQVQAQRYSDTLHALETDAEEMARHSEEVVGLFKEMYHRLAAHIAKGEKEDEVRQREQNRLAKLAEGVEIQEEDEYEEEDEGEGQ